MTPPAVVLACDDAAVIRGVAAAFEEEGVPLLVTPPATCRTAACASPLGIGLAPHGDGLAIGLSTGPDAPYVIGDDPRSMGRIAARLAARRPLGVGA
ncbi:MAG: hypothetical protein ACR2JV_06595 [Gaiellales bacterium]